MFTPTFKYAQKQASAWLAFKDTVKKYSIRKKAYVRAGIIAPEANVPVGEDFSLGQLAMTQEFGVPGHIPARSFVKKPFAENKEKYVAQLQLLPKKFAEGEDGEATMAAVLESIGRQMAGDMVKAIDNYIEPMNSDNTVKRKGFNHPLIGMDESTFMRDSINSEAVINSVAIPKTTKNPYIAGRKAARDMQVNNLIRIMAGGKMAP